MGFFQRMRNALSRFMYGRNGADQLCMATIWTAIILDVLAALLKLPEAVEGVLSIVSTLLLVVTIFRLFSRKLDKRRAENRWFLQKIWWPVKSKIGKSKQQRADRDHKYFTCPQCAAVCRVPAGKGKIVITCPRCRGEIHGKS